MHAKSSRAQHIQSGSGDPTVPVPLRLPCQANQAAGFHRSADRADGRRLLLAEILRS